MPSNPVLEWPNSNFLGYVQKLSVNTMLDFMLASRNDLSKAGQEQSFVYARIATYVKSGDQNSGK